LPDVPEEDMPVTVLRSDVLEAEDVVSEAIFVAVAAVPSTCLSTSQWNGSKAVFGSTQDGFLAA
jgi:hypothetical protein